MRRMLKDKKGVSPLVATIFLIAFAVGLGAVVMRFSEGLIGSDENPACSADFLLVISKICLNPSNELEFIAENKGKVQIAELKVLIENMDGEGTIKKISKSISENEKLGKKTALSDSMQAVQFIPLVKEGIAQDAKVSECSIRAVTFNKDDINSC